MSRLRKLVLARKYPCIAAISIIRAALKNNNIKALASTKANVSICILYNMYMKGTVKVKLKQQQIQRAKYLASTILFDENEDSSISSVPSSISGFIK